MEKRIINTAHKLSKKTIPHKHFKIKHKKRNVGFHIRPNLLNIFRKENKRKYSIIVPLNKIDEISEMSEKEIEHWLKNDMARLLESQDMPGLKMAGFTIDYLLRKTMDFQNKP